MPHREHSHATGLRDVVDVVARYREQEPTSARNRRAPIESADLWRVTNKVERRRELVEKQVWRCRPIATPPVVDGDESGRLIPEWSEPAGSPTPTQLVQNRRCRSEMSGFSRLPGRGECFVQNQALFVREIVIFVVRNKVDDRAFGQRRRLVEYEPAFFHASSKWTHETTVRFSHALRQAGARL
jgi:hypothetical protein